MEAGAEWVIAAGGDGTISEVVNGLAGTAIPLGILPGGTANVLAHELSIPLNLEAAARTLSGWSPQPVTLGHIESAQFPPRYFLMMAGAGFDADIIFHLNLDLKERMGRFSYWMGGLSRIPRRLEQLRVRVDGETYECSFALVSRVRNYGGDFVIAPDANLASDDFSIVLLEGEQGLVYLRHLAGVVTQQLRHMPGVRFLRARNVELLPTDLPVHLQADGEYVGLLPARLSVAPKALMLMMPPVTGNVRARRSIHSVTGLPR